MKSTQEEIEKICRKYIEPLVEQDGTILEFRIELHKLKPFITELSNSRHQISKEEI